MAMTASERIAARRGQIAANKSKGLKPYKFRQGDTHFRILPARDEDAAWDRRYGFHFLKNFDGTGTVCIADREICYGATDPIRELLWAAIKNAPDEDVKKKLRDMLASPRIVFNALILDDPNQPADQPVLIEMSETAFDNILAQFQVYADVDPTHDLASLDRGHVFKVNKTGQGMDTKYQFIATPKPAPLNAQILDKLIDLDAWIASALEGVEDKARERIAAINAAMGLPTVIPAGALGTPAATPQAQIGSTGVNNAAVTTAIEPEDATFEPVVDTVAAEAAAAAAAAQAEAEATAKKAAEAAAAAAAQAAAAAAAAAQPATPAAPVTPAVPPATDAAATDADEIDKILAGLN